MGNVNFQFARKATNSYTSRCKTITISLETIQQFRSNVSIDRFKVLDVSNNGIWIKFDQMLHFNINRIKIDLLCIGHKILSNRVCVLFALKENLLNFLREPLVGVVIVLHPREQAIRPAELGDIHNQLLWP